MGTLFVCATPIGNLDDASFRLVKTLNSVSLVACEDTRRTRKLLDHFNIKAETISYHQHNQRSREEHLINLLQQGEDIALVSDAGTPGVSDPGAELIKRVLAEGIRVEIIPGPSALIAALVLSGLDTTGFVFAGFLPPRANRRCQALREMAEEKRTMIFYESPRRLTAMLADIREIMGERRAAVARELTKIHEEVKRGSISELIGYFTENPPRGEVTVVVSGRPDSPSTDEDVEKAAREVLELMEAGIEKKEAFKIKAREFKVRKKDIYSKIVEFMED